VGIPWYWRVANWQDRNAASFGIEVRHPFLDRRLFEYVLAVPGEQLFRLGGSKSLLRRSMKGILPERIRRREGKTGFASFLDFAMKKQAVGEIQELLRAPRAAELEIFDAKRLRTAYLGFVSGETAESRRALWYAISLEVWLRRCEVIRRGRPNVTQSVQAAA
jgi:asparagine synthase (glutamine-hydrolysing)